MSAKNTLETLENVRENISSSLTEGVKNRRSDFRTFTFCTSGKFPTGRTVVLRGYNSESGIITLHSNYHADKIKDLNINPNVCCVFYSKGMKIQIRCFGRAVVNYDNDRSSHAWANMSDMSKECYFQVPSPGTIMDSYNDFSKEIIDKKSEAFSVIDVDIEKIDWLYLKREGHRRANIFIKESAKDTWVSP